MPNPMIPSARSRTPDCAPLGAAHDRYIAARDKWLKQPMPESMEGEIYGEYVAARDGYLDEIDNRAALKLSAENAIGEARRDVTPPRQ